MADDVTLPGTGAVIATDDVGGRQVQLVKPAFGADGAATLVGPSAGLPIDSGHAVLSGTANSLNGDLIPSVDCAGYRHVSVQVTGTFSGAVQVQTSNDNAIWVSNTLTNTGVSPQSHTSSLTGAGLLAGPIWGRYVRVRMTSYTSGTATATALLSSLPSQGTVMGLNGQSVTIYSTNGYGDTVGSSTGVTLTAGWDYRYNGGSWDRTRTPSTFKTVAAAVAGNTALWVPAAGNRWRLMRFMAMLTADAAIASGGVLTIDLQDATTSINVPLSVYVPAAGGTALGGWSSGWIDLGNGIRSAANTQTLNVNLSAALTSGTCRVVACGTEGVGTAA